MQKTQMFGPGILTLPLGFFTAQTLEAQIDALFNAADAPGVDRAIAERWLRLASKLMRRIGR